MKTPVNISGLQSARRDIAGVFADAYTYCFGASVALPAGATKQVVFRVPRGYLYAIDFFRIERPTEFPRLNVKINSAAMANRRETDGVPVSLITAESVQDTIATITIQQPASVKKILYLSPESDAIIVELTNTSAATDAGEVSMMLHGWLKKAVI